MLLKSRGSFSCTGTLRIVQLMLHLLALSTRICLLSSFHCYDQDSLSSKNQMSRQVQTSTFLLSWSCCASAEYAKWFVPKWQEGFVQQQLGPVSYVVKLSDLIRHVHIDHLYRRSRCKASFIVAVCFTHTIFSSQREPQRYNE